ncbi:MAG: HAD family hydrolase [Cyanobacteria bacterium J06635_15]
MVSVQCGVKIFQEIQAIVFDKDGTLADSAQYLRVLAQRRSRLLDAKIPGIESPLLLAFGVEDDRLDPAGLMAVGSRYENEIAAAAYVAETGCSWPEALAIVSATFGEAELSPADKAAATPLFPGCQDLVVALARAGVKIAIASTDTTANVQAFIQHYNLADHIQLIRGGDEEIPIHKPDPALLLQICQQMTVSPKATLMVGDSQLDLKMARQAGIAGAIGITGTSRPYPSLPGADSLIEQVTQLQISD